jgi:hypothetical protein
MADMEDGNFLGSHTIKDQVRIASERHDPDIRLVGNMPWTGKLGEARNELLDTNDNPAGRRCITVRHIGKNRIDFREEPCRCSEPSSAAITIEHRFHRFVARELAFAHFFKAAPDCGAFLIVQAVDTRMLCLDLKHR